MEVSGNERPGNRRKCCWIVLGLSIVVVAVLAIGLGVGLTRGSTASNEMSRKGPTPHPSINPTRAPSPSPTSAPTPVPQFPGTIFWASQPISPGETLVITGGPWTVNSSLSLELFRLPDDAPSFPTSGNLDYTPTDLYLFAQTVQTQILPTWMQTDYSITVFVPQTLQPGIFACRILLNATPFTNWYLVNLPFVWFIQGDEARTATPGGWVGLYGNSLKIKGSQSTYPQSLALVSTTSNFQTVLTSVRGNRWGQYFTIPSNLQNDTYTIYIHNGAGGRFGWAPFNVSTGSEFLTSITVLPPRTSVWPSQVYDVSLIPGASFSARLTAIFQNITKAGGGIVYLPPGNYTFWGTGSMTLPPRTIIRGAGQNQTFLFFNATNYFSVWTGGSFGLENFSLYSTVTNVANNCGCSLVTKSKSKAEVSWVKNVSLYCPGDLPAGQRDCIPNLYVGAINIDQGENLVVEDVYFDECSNCVSITGYSNHTRIARVYMRFHAQNVLLRCGRSLVMEDSHRHLFGNWTTNHFTAGAQPGFLIGEYCGQSMTRDVYYSNNTSSNDGLWNDNTVSDGKEGWYYGRINSVDGVNMIMNDTMRVPIYQGANNPATNTTNYAYMVGSLVIIVGGRGMGQYRYLSYAAYDPTNAPVTIDRPWDVVPDDSSWISICKVKQRFLAVANNFSAEGIHMWHWFSSTDVIYADNAYGKVWTDYTGVFATPGVEKQTQLSYTAGFRFGDPTWAGMHSGTWYNQVLDSYINPVSTGLDISFGAVSIPNSPNISWSGNVCFANVIRNSVNPGGKLFTIHTPNYMGAAVIENNANVSLIWFWTAQSQILLRNNTMYNGTVTYQCDQNACTNTVNGTVCKRCNRPNYNVIVS